MGHATYATYATDNATDTCTVYTVEQIRQAERPLLDAQTRPDELMQSAAAAVAAAARMMLERPPTMTGPGRVLLAVGGGGNGGDALYAGRELLDVGWQVDAVLLGRDRQAGKTRVHQRALAAFVDAGGRTVGGADLGEELRAHPRAPYRLLIDGVLGMGGSGGVDPETAVVLDMADRCRFPLLAVDVPSGIDADTGAVPDPVTAVDPLTGRAVQLPAHAVADVTVTFGGWRRAHAVNACCGQVLLADPGLSAGGSIGAQLRTIDTWWSRGPGVHVGVTRAVVPSPDPRAGVGRLDHGGQWDATGTGLSAPGLEASRLNGPTEPGPDDDKYTGGVVGVCAGSATYPGAAVLATTGAVRATSAMVRYVGTGAPEVLRATPEVIWSPTVTGTGRVQAWVVGPGRGTGQEAADELAELLARPEPLLIDADALTLLAGHEELREALIARSPDARGTVDGDRETLLTPHTGEFRRLAAAVNGSRPGGVPAVPDPDTDRIGAAVALADALHCSLLLKGRYTVTVQRPVAPPAGEGTVDEIGSTGVTCIDAGTSWGATPGSGDVLSGIAGALLAAHTARFPGVPYSAAPAVALHASAAALAAQTPDGYAPTSASKIADAVPWAWARSGPATTLRTRGPRRS